MLEPPSYVTTVENTENGLEENELNSRQIKLQPLTQAFIDNSNPAQNRSNPVGHVTTTKTVQTWNTNIFKPRKKLFLTSVFCPCIIFGKTSESSGTGSRILYTLLYISYILINMFCISMISIHIYENFAEAHYTTKKVGESIRPRCLEIFSIRVCRPETVHAFKMIPDTSKGKYLLQKIISMTMNLQILVIMFVLNSLFFVVIRVSQRGFIRRRHDIYGSLTDDIFTVCCLSSFALSQEASPAGVVQEKLFEMDEKVPEYEDIV